MTTIKEINSAKDILLIGKNTTVGTALETIWPPSTPYNFLTTPSAVRIAAGGNANDTAAGTGARTVVVEGLNASFRPISETLTTAGASASAPTSQTFIRVNRAYVLSSGTYSGANAGNMLIETTGGVTVRQISANLGSDQTAVYTVPAGKTVWVGRLTVTRGPSVTSDVYVRVRERADITGAPFRAPTIYRADGGQSLYYASFNDQLLAVPEKSDIFVQGISASSTNHTVTLELYEV